MAQPAVVTKPKAPAAKQPKQPKQQPAKLLTLVGKPKRAGKTAASAPKQPSVKQPAPKVDGRKAYRMGPCPRCGKRVAFFPTGTARPHIDPNSPTSQRCPATAKDVFELLADVMANVQAERANLRDMSQAALNCAETLVTCSEAYLASSKVTTESIQKISAELNRMSEAKTKSL